MSIKKYIDELVSKGRYFFTSDELKQNLKISDSATWSSLSRLKKKKEIASPAKGYYVIVPPEYRSLGILPPEQFIHDLMNYLEIPYYVGLLSAAQHYGASHQQPQTYQVVIPRHHRPIKVGRIEIVFIINKHLKNVPTKEFNTSKGIIRYSTPEATSIDLITYPSHCGGIDNVLTVLYELSELINISTFSKVLKYHRENPPLQRLGYLFELLEDYDLSKVVKKCLAHRSLSTVPLDTKNPSKQGKISKDWQIIINTKLETDL